METRFRAVEDTEGLEHLAAMAQEIWREYWPERIGRPQTEYMLEMFHAPQAMHEDMARKGYRYWIIEDAQGLALGYTAAAIEELTGDEARDREISHSIAVDKRWPRRLFISKVYLYKEQRGKGISGSVFSFYDELCRAAGIPVMYLTVNRENEGAIAAYLSHGFRIVDEMDNPIGGGFTMYDYAMAREVPPASGME